MTNKFYKNVGSVSAANLVSIFISILNVFFLAYFFGTSRELESYFAALTLLSITQNLTQAGLIGEVFLPLYHQVKIENGTTKAQAIYAVILNWLGLTGTLILVILFVFSDELTRLLVPGFEQEWHLLVSNIFMFIAPLIIIKIILNVVNYYFNAEKIFGTPEFITAFARIIGIIALVSLAPTHGIWGAVWALCLIDVVRLIGFVYIMRKIGYRHRWLLTNDDISPKIIIKRFADTSGYVISSQFFAFALNAGLSFLQPGSYAVFKFVERIYSKTIGLVYRPVNLVFLSYFSELKKTNLKKAMELIPSVLDKMLLVAVFLIMAVCVSGQDLLTGFFGVDRFTENQLNLAHQVLITYYGLMVIVANGQISHRISISLGYIRPQYIISSVSQLISGVCAYYLCRFYGINGALWAIGFSFGLLGIMRSVTIWYYNNQFLYIYNWKLIGKWVLVLISGLIIGFALNHALSPYWNIGRILIISRSLAVLVPTILVALVVGNWLGIKDIRQATNLLPNFKI